MRCLQGLYGKGKLHVRGWSGEESSAGLAVTWALRPLPAAPGCWLPAPLVRRGGRRAGQAGWPPGAGAGAVILTRVGHSDSRSQELDQPDADHKPRKAYHS